MATARPVVSVILPVYNGENYLRVSIESVLQQTFRDFELIVVDDGSSDTSADIARTYGKDLKYVYQENTGVAGAVNHGLRLATGRYISWLSHDDAFHSEKLEKQVAVLNQIDTPAVCYTDVQRIDSAGRDVGEYVLPEHSRSEILRHILTCGPICLASYSILYDRRCLDQVGLYSVKWRCTQDVEMLLRLARNFSLIRVPGTLMQVREHENRGIYKRTFALEVIEYYTQQLKATPLEDLFAEITEESTWADRAKARLWMAENYALGGYPLYKLALPLFIRSLPAYPRHSLRRIFSLLRHYANDTSMRPPTSAN
jgi:glycosyltransferase involved in cell wall biosynthesis